MLAIGIDLGGTNLRWAVVDGEGRVRYHQRRPSPKAVPEVVAAVRDAILECRERFPEVCGAGVAVAGVVTEDTVSSVNLDWQDVPFQAEVRFDGFPVIVENDMNAGAFGELLFGEGQGLRNLIFVTVSTGIGAGIIMNGKIYRGANGLAGEVGHTVVDLNGLLCGCGRRGCWEMIASGRAHQRRIREAFESGTWANLKEEPTPEQVTARAHSGDRAARALVLRTARYLGIGVANLVNLYDPEAVVFTGGFARNNWELIDDYLHNEVREQAFSQSTRLCLTRLGDDAGILGAAGIAMGAAKCG